MFGLMRSGELFFKKNTYGQYLSPYVSVSNTSLWSWRTKVISHQTIKSLFKSNLNSDGQLSTCLIPTIKSKKGLWVHMGIMGSRSRKDVNKDMTEMLSLWSSNLSHSFLHSLSLMFHVPCIPLYNKYLLIVVIMANYLCSCWLLLSWVSGKNQNLLSETLSSNHNRSYFGGWKKKSEACGCRQSFLLLDAGWDSFKV